MKKKITLRELAKLVDRDPKTIFNYEKLQYKTVREVKKVHKDLLALIARAFGGEDINYLFATFENGLREMHSNYSIQEFRDITNSDEEYLLEEKEKEENIQKIKEYLNQNNDYYNLKSLVPDWLKLYLFYPTYLYIIETRDIWKILSHYACLNEENANSIFEFIKELNIKIDYDKNVIQKQRKSQLAYLNFSNFEFIEGEYRSIKEKLSSNSKIEISKSGSKEIFEKIRVVIVSEILNLLEKECSYVIDIFAKNIKSVFSIDERDIELVYMLCQCNKKQRQIIFLTTLGLMTEEQEIKRKKEKDDKEKG